MHKTINLLCQQYLHFAYQNNFPHYQPENIDQTRGEILYESITQLLPIMRLNENDVFVDLGSANGRIVTQVFLTTPLQLAIGIEIVPELHQAALLIANKIKQELPLFYENNRDMHFIQGNFLQANFDQATVVMINSTCFPPTLLNALGKILDNLCSLRLVLTLKPFVGLQKLTCKKILPIECSWDSSLCYCYA